MWTNWAGNEIARVDPLQLATLDKLRTLARKPQSLRVVGAGHSFSPIVIGADRILDLSKLDIPTIGAVEDGQV